MGVGSGVGSSVSTGIEESYGSFATPTQLIPDASCELKINPHFEQGSPARAGQLVDESADHVWTTADAGGSIKTTVYDKGMLRLLGSLMGGLNSVTPSHVGGNAYQTVFPVNPQQGSSLTIQEGIPQTSGTVVRWDTLGAKVTEAAFDLSASGTLEGTWTIDAQDRVRSSSSITSLDYLTSQLPFAWQQCTVKLGTYGSEVEVDGINKWSGSFKRTVANSRFNIGNVTTATYASYGIKDEPIDNGRFVITGTLDTEYLSEAEFVDLFLDQTPTSLIVSFTGVYLNPGATPTDPASLTFAFPNVLFEGADPTASGLDIVKPTMSYVVRQDSTNLSGVSPATITVVSADAEL